MKHPEQALQGAILDLLRVAYPEVFVTHVANGGFVMDARTMARLKWQGLTPGFPDLALWWPNGGHGLLEVKSEAGRLSVTQKAVIDTLRKLDTRVEVVRSLQDVIDTLTEWQVPTRRAAA